MSRVEWDAENETYAEFKKEEVSLMAYLVWDKRNVKAQEKLTNRS